MDSTRSLSGFTYGMEGMGMVRMNPTRRRINPSPPCIRLIDVTDKAVYQIEVEDGVVLAEVRRAGYCGGCVGGVAGFCV